MSESEQLMRDAPSVRYDPRFNVKCLLGGIDNAGIPRLSRGNADPNQTNAFCTNLPNGALSVELLFYLCRYARAKIFIILQWKPSLIALKFNSSSRDLLNSCCMNKMSAYA